MWSCFVIIVIISIPNTVLTSGSNLSYNKHFHFIKSKYIMYDVFLSFRETIRNMMNANFPSYQMGTQNGKVHT